MRLSTAARSRISFISLLASSALLGACGSESTAPASAVSQDAASAFVPTASAKSLVGVSDGSYEFTVDPRNPQVLLLGANLLSLPAGSICDLATTSYGATHWDEPCAPQRTPVKITAVVRNASSSRPSIEFYPAMRFNPDTKVSIYFYVPHGMQGRANATKDWTVKYCNDSHLCVDESITDPTLRTFVDRSSSIVFRRIKHFSGYVIQVGIDDLSAGLEF